MPPLVSDVPTELGWKLTFLFDTENAYAYCICGVTRSSSISSGALAKKAQRLTGARSGSFPGTIPDQSGPIRSSVGVRAKPWTPFQMLAATCTYLRQLAEKISPGTTTTGARLGARNRGVQHPAPPARSLHRGAPCCSVLHRVSPKISSQMTATPRIALWH